jgi:CheY-like chemotaxis protein
MARFLVIEEDSLETIVEFCLQRPALPVILISGLAADSPRALGVAQMLGARRLLPKPFRITDLVTASAEVAGAESGRPLAP